MPLKMTNKKPGKECIRMARKIKTGTVMISHGKLTVSLRHIFIILTLCLCGRLQAQKFTAVANPSSVSVGEDFNISYTLSGNGSNFRPPQFRDLDVLSGPAISRNFSIVNGDVSYTNSYSFIVRARKKGLLNIPPALITVNGRQIQSNSLKIPVGGSAAGPQPYADDKEDAKSSGDIFLKASVNKKEAVEGEAVLVTYKLYVRAVDINNMIQTKMPSFSGFWVENEPMPKQALFTIENVKGRDYHVYEVKKTLLFAQKSGKLSVDPLEIECTGQKEVRRRPDPNSMFPDFPFDDFFHDVEPFQLSLKSNDVSIQIDPLPANGRPASFSGFVGQGAITASAEPKEVKQNEPVTYKLTIGGEGPLTLVQPFKLNLPDGVDAYDPKTVDKIDREGRNLSGTRTFEYTLLPRKQGSFTVPPVAFAYYDPGSKKYIEAQTAAYTIKVDKGEEVASNSSDKGTTGSAKVVHVLNGIRKWSWIAMVPIALILLILLMMRSRKKVPVPAAPVTEAAPVNEPAGKVWRDHIDTAAELTGKPEFYSQLLTAMYTFLNEKFGMSLANATRERIREALAANNVHEANRSAFTNLIERCEFANYAPGASSGLSQEHLLQEVKRLLEEMDRG
jgi:hypothetical protein